MRYKTTIKITTEAVDKNEAIEIVGDYLSGNIMSGVAMKCATSRDVNYKKGFLFIALFSLMVISGILVSATAKTSSVGFPHSASSSAVQAPLKTAVLYSDTGSFKTDWQNKEIKESLQTLKR